MGGCCPGIFRSKYGQLSENESDFEPITRAAGAADFQYGSSEEYQSGSSTLIIVKDEEKTSTYEKSGKGVANVPTIGLIRPPPNNKRESSPSSSLKILTRKRSHAEEKEEFNKAPEKEDRSKWARKRFEELVIGLEFDSPFGIEVTEVKFSTLSCVIDRSRGRPMVVYSLDFDLTWEGLVDGTSVEGKIRMEDIMPGEEEAEWYYEVQVNDGDAAHIRAGNVVRNGRQIIVDTVAVLIEELQELSR